MPTPRPYHRTARGSVFHADALDVYPSIPDGAVDLVIADGPYDMAKGAWDASLAGGALAAFYAPHVVEWSRVCAPSSTVYLCGTGRSWSTVHPLMVAAGFDLATLIAWDKGETLANRSGVARLHGWPESSEFIGYYTRDEWDQNDQVDAWNRRLARHPVRLYFADALAASGLRLEDVDRALAERPLEEGTRRRSSKGLARHYFTPSQWCFPGRELYAALGRTVPGLRAPWEDLRAQVEDVHDEHRREISTRRAYFDGVAVHPCSSVWREPPVPASQRVVGDGVAHPCQKPIGLYDRMIRASTPPAGALGELRGRPRGGLVLEPFGGTLRAATWIETAPATAARRYITADLDASYLAGAIATWGA